MNRSRSIVTLPPHPELPGVVRVYETLSDLHIQDDEGKVVKRVRRVVIYQDGKRPENLDAVVSDQ